MDRGPSATRSPNDVRRLTDQQLLALALEDDEGAYGELVRRYEAKVFPKSLPTGH